jgi:hypothetical protein
MGHQETNEFCVLKIDYYTGILDVVLLPSAT